MRDYSKYSKTQYTFPFISDENRKLIAIEMYEHDQKIRDTGNENVKFDRAKSLRGLVDVKYDKVPDKYKLESLKY